MAVTSEEEEDLKFDIDQVVWAKVKGFPWWPSIVTFLINYYSITLILQTITYFHLDCGYYKKRNIFSQFYWSSFTVFSIPNKIVHI